jgi:hypothetical protein
MKVFDELLTHFTDPEQDNEPLLAGIFKALNLLVNDCAGLIELMHNTLPDDPVLQRWTEEAQKTRAPSAAESPLQVDSDDSFMVKVADWQAQNAGLVELLDDCVEKEGRHGTISGLSSATTLLKEAFPTLYNLCVQEGIRISNLQQQSSEASL